MSAELEQLIPAAVALGALAVPTNAAPTASAPAASANPSSFLMLPPCRRTAIVTRERREINGDRLESARAFGRGRDRRRGGDRPLGRTAPGRARGLPRSRVRAGGRCRGRVGGPAGRCAAAVGNGAELPDGARGAGVLGGGGGAARAARAVRVACLRVSLARSFRSGAGAAARRGLAAEWARDPVADRLGGRGGWARPGPARRGCRRRVLVRRGRLLRPAAGRRRSVRGGGGAR